MQLHPRLHASTFNRLVLTIVLLVVSAIAAGATLDEILSRNKIIVGVSQDQGVLSQFDSVTGAVTGFEPDLAKNLADRLGVRLELVPLSMSQRERAIIDRKVDLLIASLSDTTSRRKVVLPILPHYYLSGINILTRKDDNIKSWDDLRNQRVCSEYGVFYNRIVTVRFGLDIIPLHNRETAAAALSDGRCIGMLYQESTINLKQFGNDWGQQYHIPLEKMQTPPWSIYLNIDNKNGALEKKVSEIVIQWLREGIILQLEKKWGLPSSAYAVEMNAIWNKKINNQYVCSSPINSGTPNECIK